MQTIPTFVDGSDFVTFSDQAVGYRGEEIAYNDAIGISFSSACRAGNLIYQARSRVIIRSHSKKLKISMSKFGCSTTIAVLDSIAFNEKTNYGAILEAVMHNIGANLLARFISSILQGGTVQIGPFEFDLNGITSKGVFGSRKRAGWEYAPEVRSTTKSKWYISSEKSGILEVSYYYPPTGKIISIGSVTSEDENGCLVPILIKAIRARLS